MRRYYRSSRRRQPYKSTRSRATSQSTSSPRVFTAPRISLGTQTCAKTHYKNRKRCSEFAKQIPRPFSVRYNAYTQSVELIDSPNSAARVARDIRCACICMFSSATLQSLQRRCSCSRTPFKSSAESCSRREQHKQSKIYGHLMPPYDTLTTLRAVHIMLSFICTHTSVSINKQEIPLR